MLGFLLLLEVMYGIEQFRMGEILGLQSKNLILLLLNFDVECYYVGFRIKSGVF